MYRKLSIDALEVRALLAADVLADLFPGLGSSNPEIIGRIDDDLYFKAATPEGVALFSTDGHSVSSHGAIGEALTVRIDDAIYVHSVGSALMRYTVAEGLVTLEEFTDPLFDRPDMIYQLTPSAEVINDQYVQRIDYADVDGRAFTYEAVYACGAERCEPHQLNRLHVMGVYGEDVIVSIVGDGFDDVYLAHGAQDMWVQLSDDLAFTELLPTDDVPLFRTPQGIQDLDGSVLVADVVQTFDGYQRQSLYVYSSDGTIGRIDNGAYQQLVTMQGVNFTGFYGETSEGVVIAIDVQHFYLVGHDGTLAPWDGEGVISYGGMSQPVIEQTPESVYFSDALDSLTLTQYFANLTDHYVLGDRVVFTRFDALMGQELLVQDLLPGDANVDGVFDSADLVDLFARGAYEADVDASWLDGDFDGDGRFDSADLIEALALGDYAG